MANRPMLGIRNQILLADIGDIAALGILREQVIKRLILLGANMLGDRLVPFLAIGKNGVDIKDHTAKIKDAVADHFTNGETGFGYFGHVGNRWHSRYIGVIADGFNLELGKAENIR